MRTLAIRRTAAIKAVVLKLSTAVLAACLLALVTLDFLQVVLRYLFGAGWPWAGDLSIVLILMLAWVGAGHLWLLGGHIAVDLTAGNRRLFRYLQILFGLAVVGGGLVLLPMTVETMSAYGAIDLPALPLPASVKYLPVAVGTLYLVAAASLVLVSDFAARRG